MLVARIDRTGARLVLDKAPSPPKIDQLTLVRHHSSDQEISKAHRDD